MWAPVERQTFVDIELIVDPDTSLISYSVLPFLQ